MFDFAFPRSDSQRTLDRIAARGRGVARDVMDRLRFLRAWLRNPAGVAAIAPSGPSLAALITQEIDGRSGAIIELGSGTGAFTDALIARGVAEGHLTLIEQDGEFAALLARRYPRSTVLAIDATGLDRAERIGPDAFGAAICGLGLLNMPQEQVEAILRATFACLRPGAGFYLFTYGRRCSVPLAVLERLGLQAHRIGTTLRNLPPASVFRVERRMVDADRG